MTRWGMVIDLKRCIGCWACIVACKSENSTPPNIFWTKVLEREEGTYPDVRRLFLPIRCNHCLNPPCVEACPTNATYVRKEDNIVMMNSNKCIGCQACVIACPYDARYMYKDKKGYFGKELTPFEEVGYKQHEIGTIQKCNFNVDRIDKGLNPACVEACPTKTLNFGDFDDPESHVSKLKKTNESTQLRPELGADPSIFYLDAYRETAEVDG